MIRRAAVPLALLLAVFALAFAPVFAAVPAAAAADSAARVSAAPPADPRILVLGVPGLRWDELGAAGTPRIWHLATTGATGALVVRGVDEVTPPLDGWATLSAGNRARGATTSEGIRRRNRGTLTGAQVGALGSALRSAGQCATPAGGAGAALAAAGRDGRPSAAAGARCAVRIVEIDALLAAGRSPAARLRDADAAVGAALRGLPSGGTVLLLGLSDLPGGDARLHVAIVAGPGYPAGARLRSASTRRAPFVQLVDVAPTVLGALGIARPDSMIGQPFTSTGPDGGTVADRRASYIALDRHARQMHRAVPLYFVPVVIVLVLGLGAAAALLATGRSVAGRRLARAVSYGIAAAPIGAFLADLVPWWRGPVGLIWPAALGGAAVALAAAVLLAGRRRDGVRVFGMLCAVSLLVLVADLVTGAHLQLSSVPGYDPLIAGRFAGIGNPAFGVLAAATLLTAMLLTTRWPAVLAVGLVGVAVDGAPAWGSDVGGVLALVPGVVLLTLAAAGRRISLRAALLGVAAAAGAIVAFAAADLARPAGSRTHLGRFASDLLHGHGGTTLHRKLAANWHLLTSNVATLLVPFLLVGLTYAVVRAGQVRGTAGLAAAYRRIPLLRPGLLACLLTGILGFLLNDSGVVVPAIMMLLAVPAAVVAATQRGAATAAGRRHTGGVPGARSTSRSRVR